MRMPITYKAGVAFAALVEEAEILRADPEDFDLPTPATLWYMIDANAEAEIVQFCRTLLWLGEDERHTAPVAEVETPTCLLDWAHPDLAMPVLRRAFGAQLLDEPVRYELTDAGRAELALRMAA